MSKFILIADSGSTKTDWRMCSTDGEIVQSLESIGLNPYFVESTLLDAILIDLFNEQAIEQVEEVFFYGAGCSSDKIIKPFVKSFETFFSKAKINVEHDLLGAARALLQNEPGMAAILGTGSNSCLYNGERIIDNFPSLGYILGDEGSGSYMGKQLLIKFLYNELEDDLSLELSKITSMEEILEEVYKGDFPNRFLASLSKFIFRFRERESMQVIIKSSFQDFITNHISKYGNYREIPLGVVGSIGQVFSVELNEVALENGVTIGDILKTPIEGLVEFHISGKKQ